MNPSRLKIFKRTTFSQKLPPIRGPFRKGRPSVGYLFIFCNLLHVFILSVYTSFSIEWHTGRTDAGCCDSSCRPVLPLFRSACFSDERGRRSLSTIDDLLFCSCTLAPLRRRHYRSACFCLFLSKPMAPKSPISVLVFRRGGGQF